MPAIHVSPAKGAVYTPVTKTCRVAVARGLIRTPKAWVRINDLSSLYPEGQFRTVALDAAKRFVADMDRQGCSLITPEADMLVYGPVRHRDFSGAGTSAPTWTPAPGAAPSYRASGFDIYEDHDDDDEDFLLRAEFLASRVHMAEYVKTEEDA